MVWATGRIPPKEPLASRRNSPWPSCRNRCLAARPSGHDDARRFRHCGVLGELRAEVIKKRAGFRPAAGSQAQQPGEENEHVVDIAVFDRRESAPFRYLFLQPRKRLRQVAVERPRRATLRWLLVIEPGVQCAISFPQGAQRHSDVGVVQGVVLARKSEQAHRQVGHQLLLDFEQAGGDAHIGKWQLFLRERLAVGLVALARTNQVGAIRRAVNGYFAFGAAADRANRFTPRRTESRRIPFFADGAAHGLFPPAQRNSSAYGKLGLRASEPRRSAAALHGNDFLLKALGGEQ